MKKLATLLSLLSLSGCVLTKPLTVPLRVTGAVISTVPVAGNLIDKALDSTADFIDSAPI